MPGKAQLGADSAFARAHERLLQDRTLQFAFTESPKPQPVPDWVKAIARLFDAMAPAMPYVFWGLVITGAVLILAFVVREMMRHRWAGRAKPAVLTTGVAEWRPAPAKARALLEEADRLAAQGRFADAAHVLLLRSIDDLEGRRPDLVRPALTSRDIGSLEALPAAAQPAFALIAEVVERSLFGGRPVDAAAFGLCRRAYEDFAFPANWGLPAKRGLA
jgi:hypothetical protein